MIVVCKGCNTPREVTKQPVNPNCTCRRCSSLGQTFHKWATPKFRVCERCGNSKKVDTDREVKGKLCRTCYDAEHCDYKRTCVDCGDVKVVGNARDAEAIRCKTCSAKEVARKRIGTVSKVPKIRYWYFCATCDNIREKTTKEGGAFCGTCNRKQPRKKNRLPIYFDMEKMVTVKLRHIRICPHCPEDDNTKEVQTAKLAGIKCCRKHAYVDNPEALAEKELKRQATRKANAHKHKKVYVKKPKKKELSKEAIETIKERNREHKASEEERESKVVVQKRTDEDMMAEFLAKNKPSVEIKDEPMPHIAYGNDILQGGY